MIGSARADEVNVNIAARLEQLALAHADRVAIVEQRRRTRREITFGGLLDRVWALSAGLRARGIAAGDGVVIFIPMSIDLYVALLSVLHAGATAVFMDAWSGVRRIETAIDLSRPRAFIGTPRSFLLRWARARIRAVPLALMAGHRLLKLERHERRGPTARDNAAAATVGADTPAVVTFTTGTTGQPRGALRSHGFLWEQHLVLKEHLALLESDVDMPTLPIFVLNNLASGVRSVLPDFDPRRPADIDAPRIIDQMEREGVSTATASPAFFERLLAWCEAHGRSLPLRAAFTGGAPVPLSLSRRLASPLIRGEGHVIFGSTEVEPISGITAREYSAHIETSPLQRPIGLCVGRPVPELEVRLIAVVDGAIPADSDLASLMVPAGEIGEIVVSGAHVLPSYLNDDVANRETLHHENGRLWRRTGDCASLDRDGRLWLVGRLSQRVRQAAGPLWPIPVELDALSTGFVRHAALLRSASKGTPDGAVLCVEIPDGLSPDRLAIVRRSVERWRIDEIVALSSIPRDPRHQTKTDIEALRRLLAT